MKQIREFIRLCAELFMEIDSGLILLSIFLTPLLALFLLLLVGKTDNRLPEQGYNKKE